MSDPWVEFTANECICIRHDEGMSFQRHPKCRWKGHVKPNNVPPPSKETLERLRR